MSDWTLNIMCKEYPDYWHENQADAVPDLQEQLDDAMEEIKQLKEENERLRKISAKVPPSVWIRAKKEAGYGAEIMLMEEE